MLPDSWLSSLTPDTLLHFIPMLCEMAAGTLLFTRYLRRRRPRRLAVAAAALLAVGLLAGFLQSLEHLPAGGGRTVGEAYSWFLLPAQSLCYLGFAATLIALVHWAYSASWLESLITVAVGYASQHAVFSIIALLLTAAGNQWYIYDVRLFPFRICCYAAAYAVIWLTVARRFAVDDDKVRHAPTQTALCLALLLFVVVFNMVVQKLIYGGQADIETQMLLYTYDALCSLAALGMLVTTTNLDRMASDLELMRQIDVLKERHYEMSRENIELVNTKFHDVRKNLASLRRTVRELQAVGADADADPGAGPTGVGAGPADPDADRTAPAPRLPEIPLQAIEQMENSIRVYDSIFNTGDDALDTLLTEKSLYCAAHGITLAAMADGSAIAFMDRSDVYALFGNILDNAIEAVVLLPDPDDRQITFTLAARGQLLRIEEENYYAGEVRLRDGLPVTDKGDRRFHGFGMRSIARQVAKYGGEMTIGTDDQVFSLAIVMPIPA